MSPLRQRFIDDLRLRNRSPQTIQAYVLAVKKFSRYGGRSLERLGPDDVRRYQLHLIDTQASWSQFNQAVCALRFLYNVTLRRPAVIERLAFAKRPRVLPDVLTRDEVARLLAAARPGRDRTILDVKYAGGLRLREPAVRVRWPKLQENLSFASLESTPADVTENARVLGKLARKVEHWTDETPPTDWRP
jgi:site-specific recombinase XerD